MEEVKTISQKLKIVKKRITKKIRETNVMGRQQLTIGEKVISVIA